MRHKTNRYNNMANSNKTNNKTTENMDLNVTRTFSVKLSQNTDSVQVSVKFVVPNGKHVPFEVVKHALKSATIDMQRVYRKSFESVESLKKHVSENPNQELYVDNLPSSIEDPAKKREALKRLLRENPELAKELLGENTDEKSKG